MLEFKHISECVKTRARECGGSEFTRDGSLTRKGLDSRYSYYTTKRDDLTVLCYVESARIAEYWQDS